MRMHSNTVFITGASSGIGRGLAEAFHKLGNRVIISGRREVALKSICEANLGMRYFALDVTDSGSVRDVARKVAEEFPDLNCVFNNAGVQKCHDFAAGEVLDEQGCVWGVASGSAASHPNPGSSGMVEFSEESQKSSYSFSEAR